MTAEETPEAPDVAAEPAASAEPEEAAEPEKAAETAEAADLDEAEEPEAAASAPPEDVLEAGAALGEPVAEEPDPRLTTLKIALVLDAVLLCAAVAALGILANKNTGLLAACGAVIIVLCLIAGALIRRTARLRTPAVVLFEDGLVHASTGEPVAIAWDDVKLAYITPGKLIILQPENGPDFTLRAPVSNLAKIESAIRKGVARDRIRRGLPPKNLAAV
ncbi:hypothetical protein [Actinocorallia longicatena]|uniref:YcxB-like protein n=1 Tax=Actinocorallia longicatena TaxID=111803 RepID=A0ABP6Q0I8_9ACTN